MNFFALIAVLGLLAGCASAGSRCTGDTEYQNAQTLPAPQPVEGVKAPDSPSALRIPPEPDNKVAFAEVYQNPQDMSQNKTRCLDVPPRAPEPAAEVPASAVPATPAAAPAKP